MFGCMIALLEVFLAVPAYSFVNMSGFGGQKWWFSKFPQGRLHPKEELVGICQQSPTNGEALTPWNSQD